MTKSQPGTVAASSPAGHFSEWLLDTGRKVGAPTEFLTKLAALMTEEGIPLVRLRVEVRNRHPLVMGTEYTWSRATGTTETVSLGPEEPQATDGGNEDVAIPLHFQDGMTGTLALTIDRPGGFTDDEIAEISDMASVLALLLEVHSVRHTANTLLETYVGRHTGKRVLNGQIKRGDGETIHAVIWFCDLRDSTHLAETLSLDSFLGVLNDYFDCMAGAVLEHGGEVLRFIGDAALAIFPIGGTSKLLEEACTPSEGACKRALDAARDARRRIDALNKQRQKAGDPPIRYGLALHVGDVMYGNIGVPQRLEFTVIGKAANEAARLEGMCKELGEPILISSAFPRCFPGEMRSLGTHSLRGVSEPQEVFALTD